MSHKEMGSRGVKNYNRAVKYFNDLFKKNNSSRIYTPSEIIKESTSWNEILLYGTNLSKIDVNGDTLKVKTKGFLIRCLNWNKIKNDSIGKYNVSKDSKSFKVNLFTDPSIIMKCLVGEKNHSKYSSMNLVQLRKNLVDRESMNENLKTFEKRLLYITNINNYFLREDVNLPIILYSF